MAASTWTWIGDNGSANVASNWQLTAGTGNANALPGAGDTAFIEAGTAGLTGLFGLTANTVYLGGTTQVAALIGTGLTNAGFATPSIDQASTILSAIPGATAPEASLLGAAGLFVNEGSVVANGPAGSVFTLAISSTTVNGTLVPGYFINDRTIEVDAGNAMTISVGADAEFFNVGVVMVNGGSLFFNAAPGAIVGGHAPVDGAVVIAGGGTFETNASYPASLGNGGTVGGIIPVYAFGDTSAGNTLKLDNAASFGGIILGFGQGDTIDLGASLAVGQVAFNSATGVLALEDAGGAILDLLLLGSGNFLNGTSTVVAGLAGSFIVGTGANGDTILTTAVRNDVFSNASGSWQAAGLWSQGVPGSTDTALVGLGAGGAFTLDTGAAPVTVGALTLAGAAATLRVTSNVTTAPYISFDFGGLIDVTSGNTLMMAELRSEGGTIVLDPTSVLALTGHPNPAGVSAINGTIAINNGNTAALRLTSGSLLVDGATLNAAPGVSGGGGSVFIGYDGGGTPATVTVRSNGANAASVTDTDAIVSSDPTSFGVLTISGNAHWTDAIDPHDTATTRGYMLVGFNNESPNSGTVAPAPFSGTATLAVQNGATLTEQSYAIIGDSSQSSGSVLVTGALWSIGTGANGGFLDVGKLGAGTLTVDAGGTVAVAQGGTFFNNGTTFTGSGINVGQSAASTGTLIVQNGGQVNDQAGMIVGASGNGVGFVVNGGTIKLTGTNGITVGLSAAAAGKLIVSGQSNAAAAQVIFGATAKGFTIGGGTQGTLDVENGGTIQMNGTGGVLVGQSAAGVGLIVVNGANALLSMSTASPGMAIGQSGKGALQVENGGTVALHGTTSASGIDVGQSAGANGLIQVLGTGALLSLSTPAAGMVIGRAGHGTLEVQSDGSVAVNGSGVEIGLAAGGVGTIAVNGGTLSTPGFLVVGDKGSGSLDIDGAGTVSAALQIMVGNAGTSDGTITVENDGILSTATLLIAGASTARAAMIVGSGGTVQVGTFHDNGGGTVSVNGVGATVLASGGFSVAGNSASAILTIGAGGGVTNTSTAAPVVVGGGATVTVDAGGSLTSSGGLSIGPLAGGNGVLAVTGGAVSNIGILSIASGSFGSGGSATLAVSGGGSLSETKAATGVTSMSIGAATSALLSINGGQVTVTNVGINVGGTNLAGTLAIGAGGTLINSNVSNTAVFVSATGSGVAVASVSGAGALWSDSGQMVVGDTGKGSLDVSNGGAVNAGSSALTVGQQSGGAGTISLESGGSLQGGAISLAPATGAAGTLAVAGGTVTANTLNAGGGGAINLSAGEIALSGGVVIGTAGTGATLTESGGAFSSGALTLGQNAGTSGTIAVTGGTLSTTGQLLVGNLGSGAATIGAGAALIAGGGILVNGGGSSGGGVLVIHGGAANETGSVTIGTGGFARVMVDAGGTLTATGAGPDRSQIGGPGGGNASLIVDNGLVNGSGEAVFVGAGAMVIENGGTVATTFGGAGPAVDIDATGGAEAVVTVSGTNSAWDINATAGNVIVGDTGRGSVSVSGGGVINNGTDTVFIGFQAGSAGTVTVGAGGTLVTAANPSSLSPGAIQVGFSQGATGTLQVSGVGAQLGAAGAVIVGGAGDGSLSIGDHATGQTGGLGKTDGIEVGVAAGGTGGITVSGSHALLSNAGGFIVGDSGLGALSVLGGGTVTTGPGTSGLPGLVVANAASASGSSITVSGAGSSLSVAGLLDIGIAGSGALSLSGGATVTAGSLDAANSAAAVGQISLSGAGTALRVTGNAIVADDGTGVLSVLSGATFSAANLTIGNLGDSSGALIVSGAGSVINLTGSLNIGTALGIGDLTVGPGAAVHASVLNLQGQVVLEGGLLDPTVDLIGQGQTVGGFGTIAAGDIIDEGVIQAGGNKPSQKLLVVDGVVLGGGTLSINGTVQPSSAAGVLQINAGGTLELTGAVLNGTTTFTDDLTPASTYTVANSVVNVTFADAAGVLVLDAIGGFAGTIASFAAGDQIVVNGGTLTNLQVVNHNTLTFSDSGPNAGAGGVDSIIFGFSVDPQVRRIFGISNGNTVVVSCFARGTRIRTKDGSVAVEDLCVGDRVVTVATVGPAEGSRDSDARLTAGNSVRPEVAWRVDGARPEDEAAEPIVWIGSRTVDCARHPAPETVWPVRVSAHAFGPDAPERDLFLSPDHAVFVDGVLVPAKLLINGTSITQTRRETVTYYHVELPAHAVILAEGLPVESYLDVGDRANFAGEDVVRLFPDFAARLAPDVAHAWETRGAAPLVLAGDALERVRGVPRNAARSCRAKLARS